MLRIGIDVGGTNTDAVLMKGTALLASFKAATSADVQSGIITAIRGLLDSQRLAPSAVGSLMIGTTQFTNAFVERRRLAAVGTIRLAAPATTSIPPLYDWPQDLGELVGGGAAILRGGYEFDGREIAPLDELAVRDTARAFRAKGLRAIAISCAFAPLNSAMEERAAEIVKNEIPEARLSLSYAFGRIGLLERENAAVMNASLCDIASDVISSFRQAVTNLGIFAPFFISQNDGTLMTPEDVEARPVMTFASGPTNSMRGAAYLSAIDDAIVLDVGGTTADAGALVHGFPRESSMAVDIGGVRTNFRMPDLVSLPLGGGSLIQIDGDKVRVGPHSVGHQLLEKALVFGGDTLTATDIAVAAGLADVGDRSRVAHLDPTMIAAALAEMRAIAEDAIDRIKTNRQDVPLILVGGGSMLLDNNLKGASRITIPENFAVANAVGAAIAQVGGEVDGIFSYQTEGRDSVIASAKSTARRNAIAAGADPETIRIVEVDEVPLAYLDGVGTRLRVKAIGDLRLVDEQ